jgi:hypothetical protein
MADEEGGSNRQLGFVYLYELVTRRRTLSVRGIDCTGACAGYV